MINYKVSFVRCSNNPKTGFIPTTTTESSTCPDNCSFKNNGCYFAFGHNLYHWRLIDSGERAISWEKLCDNIKGLPKSQLWRHNVGGDLPGNNNVIDTEALAALVESNQGRRGFTYSHKPVGQSGIKLVNAQAIFAANKSGFTINLSADTIDQADSLKRLGAGPVVVVLPEDIEHKAFKTPGGNQVVICPAVTREDMTCDRCDLCALPNRKAIIGFPAHGPGRKKVSKLVQISKKP